MTNVIINKEEILNEEKLDQVAGGGMYPPRMLNQNSIYPLRYPPKMQSAEPKSFQQSTY